MQPRIKVSKVSKVFAAFTVFVLGLLSFGLAACTPYVPPAGTRRPDAGGAGSPGGGSSSEGGASGNLGTGGRIPSRGGGTSGGAGSDAAAASDRASMSGSEDGSEPDRRPPVTRDAGPVPAIDAADNRGDVGTGTKDADDTSSTVVSYNVYLGQTHAHSDLSRVTHDEFPGMDLPAVGFAKAKAKGADFYFITDHVDGSGSISPKDFQTIKTAALAATDATFVAGAGIEYHLDANEVNMVGADYDAAHMTSRRTSVQYLDYLLTRPGDPFIQWNHPLRSGLPEHKYDGYTPARDRIAALVEVLNEGDTPAAASYQRAVDMGWHVGPAAGHDNHGDSWYELPTRTGVLAPALTRDAIYDAIREQRVYCSQDPAWKIWYELNGKIMGTTIAPAPSYMATVKIQGGSRVTKIELLSKGGAVVATGAPTAAGEWTTAVAAQPGNFYYVRLTGTSSVRAWTAPVWVTAP